MADSALLDLARWRVGAPALAERVATEWDLRLGEPYVPGVCGYVVRAELPDGTPAVLKARDAALHFFRELAPTQGEQVLVHQDLHAENVLAAEREPWLVIDPKPLAGEREFAVAPIVRSFELGHSKRAVLYRLDKLTADLGLDRDRARGWAIAQTVAWSGGSSYVAQHMETVGWLLEDAS